MPDSAASPQTYSDDQSWLSVSPALAQGGDWAAWLQDGETQLEAMAQQADRVLGTGRGAARAVTFGLNGDSKDSTATESSPNALHGAWRINRHGGMLGGIRGDRYRDAYRLQQEVNLSGALRFMGVKTPEVLLAYSKRHGSWWRQHLVTEEIRDAVTVFDARESAQAMQAAGALLEQIFSVGLWATDLHPANLLWQQDQQQCWLIDLAGAELRPQGLSSSERRSRVERFARYFKKHAGSEPAAMADMRRDLLG
ncbi:MAG: hypothetical protein GY747_14235 [Planctomycetes bacterium]|nr:hypothetical protein [Planctomycetota bacterium]MCP4770585.1 hypothetical protein [Planctomycetota bacterium]MCP4861086.1 hypothetical protein [Planctomycetota bacterium]